jgi:hypothetical protein
MALQNLVQRLLDKGGGKDREQIIADLKAKNLETDPDILSEKARWYGTMALRSDEERNNRSISERAIEDSKRKSDYKLIRYSLRLLDGDLEKMMNTEIRKERLEYLKEQRRVIEAALLQDYIDEEEEVERMKRRLKTEGRLPEDA